MDKVSVIVFGPSPYDLVIPSLHSIFNSTYRNVEVILLNDGTLTGYDSLLEEFEGKILHVKDVKSSRAQLWNKGASMATGEMLSFIDGKDVSGNMRLELLVKKLLGVPDVGLAFCGTTYINTEGRFLRGINLIKDFSPEQGLSRLFEGNYISSLSTTLITKEAFEKAGRFDETLNVNFDYDLYLRIAKEYTIQYLDLPLLRFRMVPDENVVPERIFIESERYILNKHDVAIIADSLTKLYDREETFRISLGKILFRMGWEKEAVQNIKRALYLNSENSEAYFIIGNYYYYKRDFEEARKWYIECLTHDPNHAGSSNNLGVIYYLSGAWDESRAEFDRARNLQSNFFDPIFNLQCLQKKAAAEHLRITGFRERSRSLSRSDECVPTRLAFSHSLRDSGT